MRFKKGNNLITVSANGDEHIVCIPFTRDNDSEARMERMLFFVDNILTPIAPKGCPCHDLASKTLAELLLGISQEDKVKRVEFSPYGVKILHERSYYGRKSGDHVRERMCCQEIDYAGGAPHGKDFYKMRILVKKGEEIVESFTVSLTPAQTQFESEKEVIILV